MTRERLDDRALIEAAQADPTRFDAIYERYAARVYAFALSRTRERARAEDVTSETFHRALRDIPRFRWRGVPLSSWLFTIASSVIAREANLAARPGPPGDEHEPDFAPEVVERARLWTAVAGLEADHRVVLSLRFADELPTAEVARQMDRSEGAIKQLQRRALIALRERMEDGDE